MALPRLAPRPSSDLVDAALDHYVDTVSQRLASTVLATIASFEEPAVPLRPDRAMRMLGCLIETLAGHAIGSAIGPMVGCMKRYAADDGEREAIRRELAAVMQTLSAAPVHAGPMIVRRVIADAARRPLVDELGARLHLGIARGASALRVALRRIAAVIANPALLVATIRELADDDASALRFGDQLAIGWRVYLAAQAGRALPEIGHAASRAHWRGWLRRVRNEREVRCETSRRVGDRAQHGEAVRSDYITRIG